MDRIYRNLLLGHLKQYRQMALLAGPSQVGKTSIAHDLRKKFTHYYYFNWDSKEDRELIISGPKALAQAAGLDLARETATLIVLDELHKYGKWKQFIKGFFDLYEKKCKILITGSAKLNIFRRQGDSLMGRYFLYRVHPMSVAELIGAKTREHEIQRPKEIPPKDLESLFTFGGFPEPYSKHSLRFSKNWQRLKQEQLIAEDIRDLTQIQNLAQLDMLAEILKSEAGHLIQYKNLSNQINVAEPTVKRWIQCLEQFYYCFRIKPWSKNVRSSLRKEPKLFLWDWSVIENHGDKVENFIASHLLKAVHYWTDTGLGNYDLYYVRDKKKNEVDFLVTKDQKPWFLVEAKASATTGISKALHLFQKQTAAKHAFQVAFDMDYIAKNCFDYTEPVIVPASTFLSQLV